MKTEILETCCQKTYSLKIVTFEDTFNEPINFVLWLDYNIDSQTGKVFGNCESSINKNLPPLLRKQLKMHVLARVIVSFLLMHPKHEVEKTYDTWVTGYNPDSFKRLKEPVELDGYTIRPPRLKLLKAESGTARIEITIHEGRYRQVRRMCEKAGMHVTRLKRIREGKLELGSLPKGTWRYLNPEEVERLK